MNQEVDLKRLETLIGRWAPRLLELIADLRAQGIGVRLSLGVPLVDRTGPARAEISIRISLTEE